MKKEIITYKDPKSPISEAFRTLRTNIQFMNMNKSLKTLLITSTLPGEGKSWVSANLAVTFAQAGKRVVLIDADMRKGRQYALFEVAPKPGLSNYLAGIDENNVELSTIEKYIQQTEVTDLFIMTAGNIPPNPSELLVSAQMINLIKELEKVCDLVIIDGTPCELVTDSVILSRMTDSTVIVTAHNHTNKATLEKTVKSIQNVGGNIAGIVLNKIPISAKKYEKSYYYGSTSLRDYKKEFKAPQFELSKKDVVTINKNENKTKPKQKAKGKIEIEDEEKTQEQITPEVDEKANVRVNDILQQVNEYLETEKKKLK